MMLRAFGLGLFLLACFAAPVAAQGDSVSGPARVIDSDVLVVADQRVMLWGVDAPERPQLCDIGGRTWTCSDTAKRKLETLSGVGDITCELTGNPDVFRRRWGVCRAADVEINAEMVRQGMALAVVEQTSDYLDEQDEAKAAQVGLWMPGVTFEEPWVYRANK